MSLAPGTRLGVYDVVAPIGAGGMGEVYRARDSKLHRDVALKILPEAFSSDPERIARFEREARTLASLNHPQIAQIYGFQQSAEISAFVMELVEGEDLAQRLARRALPIDEALAIARQIADALEAAHEQGIIHRDLKPANVKVRPDGTVKVLDFGLAKALDPAGETGRASQTGGEGRDALNSPTITSPAMTLRGMILGTAAYMSPEQAKGKPIDKRADIWAFGCVLFEMLTGTRAFPGDDVTETLAFVITKDPEWTALPASTPPPIRKLLGRCLEKDRKRRLADIADARLEIDDAIAGPVPSGETTTVSRTGWSRVVVVAGVAAVVFGIAGAIVSRQFVPAQAPPSVMRFSIMLREGEQFRSVGRTIAISPEGSLMLFAVRAGLVTKPISSFETRVIPGTADTQGALNPVFSPDGQAVAFWAVPDQTIRTIAITGGATLTLGPAARDASAVFSGMTWGRDGILVGQGAGGIIRMSPRGGGTEVLVKMANNEAANAPQMLPDGEHVLFTVITGTNVPLWSSGRIVVQSLKSGDRKTLVERGSDARYLPTGHLIYADAGILYAAPFDVDQLTIGPPAPIVEGVRRASASNATSQFSVSDTGTLVYLPGPTSASAFFDLARFDRQRRIEPLRLPAGAYEAPRVSPDGSRVAFSSDDGKESQVWIYELSGKTAIRRLTFGGRNRFPVWSPDGQRVAFRSDREGDPAVFLQRADGSGRAERMTKPERGSGHTPETWSRSGYLLYNVTKDREVTLWALDVAANRAERFGIVRSFSPTNAAFSPDGRWVAYGATEEGRSQSTVYVQPFPATGATYQISRDDDGHHPVWSRDGVELAYVPGPGRVVVARVTTSPSFNFTPPQDVAAPGVLGPPNLMRNYDYTRDGAVFIGLLAADGQSGATTLPMIHVVLNWFEELRARVPIR